MMGKQSQYTWEVSNSLRSVPCVEDIEGLLSVDTKHSILCWAKRLGKSCRYVTISTIKGSCRVIAFNILQIFAEMASELFLRHGQEPEQIEGITYPQRQRCRPRGQYIFLTDCTDRTGKDHGGPGGGGDCRRRSGGSRGEVQASDAQRSVATVMDGKSTSGSTNRIAGGISGPWHVEGAFGRGGILGGRGGGAAGSGNVWRFA